MTDTKHTDSVEAHKLVDYYMEAMRRIDGLRGMGQSTEKEITTVLFALIITLQATQSQQVEEAVRKEREQVLSHVVRTLEEIHYPWSINGGTHIDRRWAIKLITPNHQD